MLQAHSLLWHYLWLAPNVLGLVLAVALWRGEARKHYPLFAFYLSFVALEQFCLYWMDLSPFFSAVSWWRAFWVGTILEGLLKFAVIAELLTQLLRRWPSIAKLGRNVVTIAGVVLVLAAAVAAAYAAPDNTPWLIGGAHVLLQTIYIAQAGLILSIFALVAYFRIPWDRAAFGIALGYALVWCEHLAVWALVSGGVARNRDWVDLANMASYHFSVVLWFCYLLVPERSWAFYKQPRLSSLATSPAISAREELDLWNRELERLLQ